jgi:sigma-B regulation protein RsbU (phosphoserine phosphatase)
MDEAAQLGAFALIGDADPVPQTSLLPFPDQAKTLLLLYDVSRELTAILDREELLRRIAEHVKRLVNYHVFSVMLWNEKAQMLESVFALRYGDSIPARSRVPLHLGITGTAAGERRTLRVNDVREDSRYIQCETDVEVRSELVVPLLLQDRLIGVLDLESATPHAFTADQERTLTTLGSFIAIALENARLYEEARENQRRLQSDLDTAREIQQQLLPTGAREVPGLDLAAAYIPAFELGGDFYDFLPYGEGRIAIALGDVSGKGTAAALYGSLAIGTLRELVVGHPDPPAEMLAVLNHRLHGARLDARFIALLFAVYDAAKRTLTFANAGGPYPLLVRNKKVQELRVEGVPLGLLSGVQYDDITVDLLEGDVVIFASDGILESANENDQEFGHARLSAFLAGLTPQDTAREIGDRLLAATDNHAGFGIAPHDDRTLVVLRITKYADSETSRLPIIY